MLSYRSLVYQAWNTLFYSKKSLLSLVFISLLPTIVVLLFLWIIAGGAWWVRYFDLSIPAFSEISTSVLIIGSVLGIVLFITFLFFTLICSYLSMKILVNNFEKKHENWKKLLSHWKESINFFKLWLCLFFYTIGWIIVGCLGFLLLFFHELFIIPATLFLIGLIFYKVIPLTMTSGVFFFENISGFQAIKTSQKLILGRWWKTVGYMVIVVIISLAVVLFVGIIEFGWSFGLWYITENIPEPGMIVTALISLLGSVSIILQTLLQTLLKFFYSSYLFTLYKEYKNTSLSHIK